MNILFLTDNPTLGGTIRILQSWLPLMRERGLNGHVVTPPGSDFQTWLAEHNVPHTSSPMPWPDRWWPVPSLFHAWKLARWARQYQIDVIHFNEHNIYPFGLALRRFLPQPIVCHVRYRLERPFAEWVFGRKSRRPDALLWTSRQQQADSADAVRGIVPDEIQHVIPLGLDLSWFGNRQATRAATRAAWGFRPDEIVIGQACALMARKRLDEFVEMVARLAAEDERVVGVLAGDAKRGDESYREQLLRRIAETGLGRRFRWVGNVDDIEPFYQGLDVFVSTSEYETFGNSVCEAMACARPVIAYQGGSVQEVVGDSGRIVANGDLEGLIAAVRECLVRTELREDLGARARQRVAEVFNPARTLDQLVGIYRSILSRRADSLSKTGRPRGLQSTAAL